MADGRVVIDTNVYLSASISRNGVPARAVKLAFARFEPVYSRATILELADKLNSEKMARWIDAAERMRLMAYVLREASLVEFVPLVRGLSDPNDDMFASLALAADARAIVTGDKKFLAASSIGRIPILTARQFLNQFGPR